MSLGRVGARTRLFGTRAPDHRRRRVPRDLSSRAAPAGDGSPSAPRRRARGRSASFVRVRYATRVLRAPTSKKPYETTYVKTHCGKRRPLKTPHELVVYTNDNILRVRLASLFLYLVDTYMRVVIISYTALARGGRKYFYNTLNV